MNYLNHGNGNDNGQPMSSYQSRVASICPKFQHLSHLSNFLDGSTSYPLGRIECLEFPNNNSTESATSRRLTLSELASLINPCQESPILNRILIVEDLTKEVIEILGSSLNIDPAFFAHHLYSSRIDDSTGYTGPIRVLPSAKSQGDFIVVPYVVTVILGDSDHPPPERLRCRSNVRRKLDMLSSELFSGFFVAMVARRFSVLRVPQSCGAWLGIVLVDPPIGNKFVNDNVDRGYNAPPYLSQVRPFGNGSYNFNSSSRHAIKNGQPSRGRARDSMLEDIIYCWTNRLPPTFDTANGDLLSLAYYPFKIATGEFMLYVNCMRFSIENYVYHVGSDFESNLKALESALIYLDYWRRRTRSRV
ncbi:hypothetical protein GP486_003157 [Trichoglossum hirsutum]|uniref:Uncharacterized protein n=1 Tax=Trichoglossum hirsutum TaxID=265104 RepID=A0A9P8LDH1_9PEZI|nr:hypothetical protein GP486_003157 [Trichoglossum hirsutum]